MLGANPRRKEAESQVVERRNKPLLGIPTAPSTSLNLTPKRGNENLTPPKPGLWITDGISKVLFFLFSPSNCTPTSWAPPTTCYIRKPADFDIKAKGRNKCKMISKMSHFTNIFLIDLLRVGGFGSYKLF